MRGRIEAGAAVAGLFIALGSLALGQHWGCGFVFAFFALGAAAIAAAFANRIWFLHKLPLIGAPQLLATLTIDGRSGQAITMPDDGANRYFLICLGIANDHRVDVAPAHVNFLLSEGLNPLKCDHLGAADETGRWMRPTTESIGADDPDPYKDYYAETRSFPGGNSVVWWFRIMLRSHGTYRFRLKINSPVLYRESVTDFFIHAGPRGAKPSTVDRLDDLIDQGEALVSVEASVLPESGLRTRVTAYIMAGGNALPPRYRDGFLKANSRLWDGRGVEESLAGKPYLVGLARAKLSFLYEARRRIGDEGDCAS